MKNNIKKITATAMALTLFGTGIAVSNVVSPNANTAYAASSSAVNQLSYNWEVLTTSKTVNGTTIPTGAAKISLVVTNNRGVGIGGIRIPYNPQKLDVIKEKNGSVLVEAGAAGDGRSFTASYNENRKDPSKPFQGIIGLGFIGEGLSYEDGVMCSVYVVGKKNVNLAKESVSDLIGSTEVERIIDEDCNQVEHTEPQNITVSGNAPKDASNKIEYIIGDVSGNGKIGAEDPQLICNMIKDKGTYSFRDVLSADVDGNGIVEMDDAVAVLEYYSNAGVGKKNYDSTYNVGKNKVFYEVKSK